MKTTTQLWNEFKEPYENIYNRFILWLMKKISIVLLFLIRFLNKDKNRWFNIKGEDNKIIKK